MWRGGQSDERLFHLWVHSVSYTRIMGVRYLAGRESQISRRGR
jgi:hypothetical protein